MRLSSRISLLLLCVWAVNVFPQVTTGTLSGTVTSQGNAVAGVTVTVSSPDLQGTRTAVTGEAGGYRFPALPPGNYTATFELEGMQRVTKNVTVVLAQDARVDADLRVASVAESITVSISSRSC